MAGIQWRWTESKHVRSAILAACFGILSANVCADKIEDIPLIRADNIPGPMYSSPIVRRMLQDKDRVIVHYSNSRDYSTALLSKEADRWERVQDALGSKNVHIVDAFGSICAVIDKIRQLDRRSQPAYAITDSLLLGENLRNTGCFAEVYDVRTLAQLKSTLQRLNGEPRGILINAVQYVDDTEYNTRLGPSQVTRYMLRYHRHIDVSVTALEHNLSLVIVSDSDPTFLLNVVRLKELGRDVGSFLFGSAGVLKGR